MQNTQNAVNSNEYRNIPIAALVESASNPRKRFDEKVSKNWPIMCPGQQQHF